MRRPLPVQKMLKNMFILTAVQHRGIKVRGERDTERTGFGAECFCKRCFVEGRAISGSNEGSLKVRPSRCDRSGDDC